jgi:hypothetical protein
VVSDVISGRDNGGVHLAAVNAPPAARRHSERGEASMPHKTALGPIDAAPTSPGPEMTIGAQHNVDQGYYAEGFVAAIAAAAGLDVQWPRLGARIDLCVFLPGPNGTSGSKQMDIQVKSWSTGSVSADGNFHYPLEVPAFNYLAGDGHDVRHYLVLCIVPPNATGYSDAQHDRLRLHQAAYWLSLVHQVPDPTLNPQSTKTVLVPRTHLVTVTTIRALVEGHEAAAVVP